MRHDILQANNLYDQIYLSALNLMNEKKNISPKILREELFIPYKLSLEIMEKLEKEYNL